jgi:hypothetical protein
VAAASTTPVASAATQRYASPTGSGTACSSASPCGITDAVNGASAGDEVIVSPGDYPLTGGTLGTPDQITIRGVAGQPRPRLMFSGPGQLGLHIQFGSTLRYVEVDQAAATTALYAYSSTVDQVIARGTAGDTAEIDKGTIRNSTVVASGPNGHALVTEASGDVNTSTYRNVTAIATGFGGTAIQVRAGFAAGNATVNLVNVIARGGADLEARTDGSGAHATITATHANYLNAAKVGSNAAFIDLGGNQSYAPAFVNWAAGDYHQAAGSPTTNAGLNDPANGAFDVDGDPRKIGTTDIGADEFVVAPAATTGPAGAVTDRLATLSGSVNANGAPTSYHFEYGPTTAYGSTTPTADAGSGTGVVAAGATLGSVTAATTYHYRVVATNAGGVTQGTDQTFTTAAPPATSSTATVPPTQGFAGVKLLSTKLTMAGRFITLKLSCPARTVGRCSGRTKLTARHRRAGSRTATIVLGRATFSIAAGKQAKVKVRVSRAARRLLMGVPRLKGNDANAARDGAGQSKTTVAAVTIRRHHR